VALQAWPLNNCRLGALSGIYEDLPQSQMEMVQGVVKILVYDGKKESVKLVKMD